MQAVLLYTAAMTSLHCFATQQQPSPVNAAASTVAALTYQQAICDAGLHGAAVTSLSELPAGNKACGHSVLQHFEGTLWFAAVALGLACTSLTVFYIAVTHCSTLRTDGAKAQPSHALAGNSATVRQDGLAAGKSKTRWFHTTAFSAVHQFELVWCTASTLMAAAGIMTRFGVVMFVSFVAQCAAALVLSAVVLVVSVAVIWLSSFDLATTVALLNLKRHVDCL